MAPVSRNKFYQGEIDKYRYYEYHDTLHKMVMYDIHAGGVPTTFKKLGDFLLSLFLVTSERLEEKSPLTKTTCLPVTRLSQPFIIFKNIIKLFF